MLADQGHAVVWLRRAAEARHHLQTETFDTVLLDFVLPDGSGLELLSSIRSCGDTVPVMMLTARDAVSDRVAGLDGGADDYLPTLRDGRAAVAHPCAAAAQSRSAQRLLAGGDLSIDTLRRRVLMGDDEVALSAREYDILVTLAADPGPGQVESGSGLGLAIVQRVAAAEDATLRFIEGLSGRGVGFSLRMGGAVPNA